MAETRDLSVFVRRDADGIAHMDLAVEGVACAGCIRKIESGLKQLPGITDLIDEALGAADEAAPTDEAVADIRPRLQAAATTAKEALVAFEAHLRDVVLPASEGEGRLGRALFAEKMRHTMRSDDMTPERIMEAAERQFAAVRAEMVRLAREMWPTWGGGERLPEDEGTVVRSVLDAIAADHPPAETLLDFCREENARIEAFCRERDLIGLADEPMDIRWTPVFLRAFGGAMLIAPGPLVARQTPTFRSSVDLVTVDAAVHDGDGRPIATLGPGDFSLEVDGRPRPVVSAQFLTQHAGAPGCLV